MEDPIWRSRSTHREIEQAPRWVDTYFIDMLRESEGNPDLDIVWLEDMGRARPVEPDEAAACPRLASTSIGCWAVVTRAPMLVRSMVGHLPLMWGIPVVHFAVTAAPTPILLDGMYGLPMVPGPWLYDRLAAADRFRHNTTGELANMRRRQRIEAEHAAQDAWVKDVAREGSILREFRKDIEREGATPTREDNVEQFRRAEQWMLDRERRRALQIQDAEMARIEVEAGR